jgi:hypothetical protein
MSQSQWGNLIWGKGPQDAIDLIGARTVEQLRSIPGLTPEAAQRLAAFYAEKIAEGRGGLAAPARVTLMEHIYELLTGQG